jgi:hypothetical protein
MSDEAETKQSWWEKNKDEVTTFIKFATWATVITMALGFLIATLLVWIGTQS